VLAGAGDAQERVAAVCRVLGRLGLTREPAGHVSMRLDDGTVAVKSRGAGESGLRYAAAEDVVVVDLDGVPVDGGRQRPPQEVPIHLEIYRARPEVHSVVHVHPLDAVLLTVCDLPLAPVIGAYDPYAVRLLAHEVPVFDRSVLVSTPELGTELAAVLGSSRACLMRGHGITTVGATPEEAGLNAVKLSELAHLIVRAHALGAPRPIDAGDLALLVGDGSTRQELVDSAWDFYRRLAGEGIA
jgi:ribulose-5-phosphate 4-epimerase/fuculose-1-phosphate aldolase